jgi:hypothetical protein
MLKPLVICSIALLDVQGNFKVMIPNVDDKMGAHRSLSVFVVFALISGRLEPKVSLSPKSTSRHRDPGAYYSHHEVIFSEPLLVSFKGN